MLQRWRAMDKSNSSFRWVVFASVLLTYLFIASQRTAPGLITEQLMNEMHMTASSIGLMTSMQFLIYTGFQIPMGILADRYGPNFFLISGTALTGLGTLIYSLGTHELVLIGARMMAGMGDAAIWVNMVLILGEWFHGKEFVRLIGLTGMTGSFGFLLASVPFSLWMDLLGWRAAFLSAGLVLCSCAAMLYWVLVRKTKHLFPETSVPIKNEFKQINPWFLLQRIISDRQAMALFFCHFGIVGGYIGFISSWAVPYGMGLYGMTRADASQLIMMGLFGALVGAPVMSWISSRMQSIKRPYTAVHICTVMCWCSFLIFKGSPSNELLVILFFIIGFGFGASALTFALVRQSFPVLQAGIASGFANTGGFLSAVLLPSIFGKILDHFQYTSGNIEQGYFYGFIAPFIFSMIGLIGVSLIKENRREAEIRSQKISS